MKRQGLPSRPLSYQIKELIGTATLRDANKVLRAVIKTIKDALLRGEKVYVKGFGTFKVVTRTPNPTPNNFLTSTGPGLPTYSTDMLYYKPRRVVIFKPSVPLMGMLNLDTPNYEERRAQLCWNSTQDI